MQYRVARVVEHIPCIRAGIIAKLALTLSELHDLASLPVAYKDFDEGK